jgi:hypothetical protein
MNEYQTTEDDYPATCARCFDDPQSNSELCEACEKEMSRAAMTTAVAPTVADWKARAQFADFIEIRGGYPSRWIGTIDRRESREETMSNAAVIGVANQMWEFISAQAKATPKNREANALVEKADAVYRRLMNQSAPTTSAPKANESPNDVLPVADAVS